VSNTRSEERNTVSYSYSYVDCFVNEKQVTNTYAERGKKYGILFMFSLFWAAIATPGTGAYVSNTRSEERNTVSYSYLVWFVNEKQVTHTTRTAPRTTNALVLTMYVFMSYRATRDRSLRVEYAERGTTYGILFICG